MPRGLLESLIDPYAEAISSQNAVMSSGAGLCIPAGLGSVALTALGANTPTLAKFGPKSRQGALELQKA